MDFQQPEIRGLKISEQYFEFLNSICGGLKAQCKSFENPLDGQTSSMAFGEI
jgi:hypothetical protein